MEKVPADIFKIDGSLIDALPTNQDSQSRVKEFTSAAREKDILCIAERVDDAAVLALLWQYGVDAIQGFFIQEPSRELGYEFESEIV